MVIPEHLGREMSSRGIRAQASRTISRRTWCRRRIDELPISLAKLSHPINECENRLLRDRRDKKHMLCDFLEVDVALISCCKHERYALDFAEVVEHCFNMLLVEVRSVPISVFNYDY